MKFPEATPAPEECVGLLCAPLSGDVGRRTVKDLCFSGGKTADGLLCPKCCKTAKTSGKAVLRAGRALYVRETLESDLENIERFEKAVTYSDYYEAFQKISWKKLAANRDKTVSKEKAEQVKALREEMKGS